jgi:hypothetical protein
VSLAEGLMQRQRLGLQVPGILEAPLGVVVVSVLQLEDAGDFQGIGLEVAARAHRALAAFAESLALGFEGYVLLTRPGALQVTQAGRRACAKRVHAFVVRRDYLSCGRCSRNRNRLVVLTMGAAHNRNGRCSRNRNRLVVPLQAVFRCPQKCVQWSLAFQKALQDLASIDEVSGESLASEFFRSLVPRRDRPPSQPVSHSILERISWTFLCRLRLRCGVDSGLLQSLLAPSGRIVYSGDVPKTCLSLAAHAPWSEGVSALVSLDVARALLAEASGARHVHCPGLPAPHLPCSAPAPLLASRLMGAPRPPAGSPGSAPAGALWRGGTGG